MLEKTFQPSEIEPRVRAEWDEAEAFKAGKGKRPESGNASPFAIVIPPPNVTGTLHMGHALNNTLQDVLVRFERMRGRDVLWQPGTDHAGIATQMVVERKLAADKQPGRRELGREEFLKRVWTWKGESGGAILNQLKRLGASCDWSRERFTMDEGLSKAVVKVFVDLYNAGLIYKDKRLVNWDPKFQTAISDLEVVQKDKAGSFKWADGDAEKPFDAAALAKVLAKDPSGHMYHFRYPLAAKVKGYAHDYIVVATTRPETMLGDTAVAVHPEDERYAALIKAGAKVKLPLVDREIPIVADEYSDMEKGTGAVKITPAHDFNDFEVGKRHNLPQINVLDAFGKINENGGAYQGLDRFEARKKIVADLAALGLLAAIEPTKHAVPHGDRSDVPVEPWLTDQWYVKADVLAKPALEAVRAGKTKFVPERFANDYYRWLENIQPWCISRQLWWGHQIPAWYGPDGHVFVATNEAEARALAKKHYASSPSPRSRGEGRGEGRPQSAAVASKTRDEQASAPHPNPLPIEGTGRGDITLTRDEDVLDTWFSSALWPFSTLGWPDKTPELATYYPTSVLVTGFDIIFFWVARMMMMGVHFMGEVPFKDVVIHGLVRDAQGHKMSKTRGNTMDPLDIIDGISLDALLAKRTAGLDKEAANRVARDTKKEFPEGISAYGTDALRFTMAAMASQGSDVKLSIDRVEGYRNFATKLWNAARFAEQNECVRQRSFDPKSVTYTFNQWIAGETERASAAVTTGIESYKYNEAAASIYEFVWGVFCDWYLELVKPILMGDDEAAKTETRATIAWVIDQILKLLHPFMPYITEELWAHMVEHGEKRKSLLCLSEWPRLTGLQNAEADAETGWLVALISNIRSLRSEMNVNAGAKIPLVLVGASREIRDRANAHEDTIKRLARLDTIAFEKTAPKGSAMIVIGETMAALPLEGIIDLAAERKRLQKEIDKAESDRSKAANWLANEANVAKSPEHVVELNRERVTENAERVKRLAAALKRIEA